jgi:PleD family two-component response regulator
MQEKRYSLLVVDDDISVRKHISSILEKYPINIVEARNGKEAIESVKIQKFDLILLDALLPLFDGFQACEIIKTTQETKSIPVIIFSILNRAEDVIRAKNSGADDYIVKPIKSSVLLEKISKFISIPYKKE